MTTLNEQARRRRAGRMKGPAVELANGEAWRFVAPRPWTAQSPSGEQKLWMIRWDFGQAECTYAYLIGRLAYPEERRPPWSEIILLVAKLSLLEQYDLAEAEMDKLLKPMSGTDALVKLSEILIHRPLREFLKLFEQDLATAE
jgi:hypothetical protein